MLSPNRVPLRRRLIAGALAVGLSATACAGGSSTGAVETADDSGVDPATDPTMIATTAPVTDSPAADRSGDANTAPAPTTEPTTAPAPTTEPTTAPAPATEPTTAPAPATVAVDLPAVEVVDLASGQTSSLASYARPGPTLLWFWAPH